jgi:hypothetical protein
LSVFALEVAGSVPPASVAIGGWEMSATPTLPSPKLAPSAGAALLEAEVEKSIEMGMAALEKLSRFGQDSAPEVALPKESAAPLPLATEASRSTMEAGADTGAQVAVKEVVP